MNDEIRFVKYLSLFGAFTMACLFLYLYFLNTTSPISPLGTETYKRYCMIKEDLETLIVECKR